ncbi:MAG TPA: 6-phosphogluconolactonase [Solirubrobacterales bacterium]|nr:6-phosphogluconolactonase [Solirubrobacterales bacterium]
MADHRLEVLDDADAVHRHGAELIAEAAGADISERGHFALAVSGGRDPWPMFSQLEDFDLDWTQIEIFQVDERVAPAGSDQRNLTHLVESLSIGAQGSIRPMPVTDDDLEAAADRYAESLPDALGLAHMGIGPDGHTASLVPNDPVLDVTEKRVAVTTGEYEGVRRMTLTYPELHRVRRLLWVVTGEEKRDALEKLLARDPSIPAARVDPGGDSLILADRAAAPEG